MMLALDNYQNKSEENITCNTTIEKDNNYFDLENMEVLIASDSCAALNSPVADKVVVEKNEALFDNTILFYEVSSNNTFLVSTNCDIGSTDQDIIHEAPGPSHQMSSNKNQENVKSSQKFVQNDEESNQSDEQSNHSEKDSNKSDEQLNSRSSQREDEWNQRDQESSQSDLSSYNPDPLTGGENTAPPKDAKNSDDFQPSEDFVEYGNMQEGRKKKPCGRQK